VPHFFIQHLDLIKGISPKALNDSATAVWILVRKLMLDAKALEQL